MALKIAQINLRKSPFNTAKAFQQVLESKLDIVAITEPNFNHNRINGLPPGCTSIHHQNTNKIRAAIVILNNNLSVLQCLLARTTMPTKIKSQEQFKKRKALLHTGFNPLLFLHYSKMQRTHAGGRIRKHTEWEPMSGRAVDLNNQVR